MLHVAMICEPVMREKRTFPIVTFSFIQITNTQSACSAKYWVNRKEENKSACSAKYWVSKEENKIPCVLEITESLFGIGVQACFCSFLEV